MGISLVLQTSGPAHKKYQTNENVYQLTALDEKLMDHHKSSGTGSRLPGSSFGRVSKENEVVYCVFTTRWHRAPQTPVTLNNIEFPLISSHVTRLQPKHAESCLVF